MGLVALAIITFSAPALAETEFRVGQIWSYQTRPGESESTVTIVKLEVNEDLGDIAHIRIDGVKLKSPSAPSGIVDFIGHMPYEASALKKSVTELRGTTKSLPDFEEGYEIWKSAFDQGKAGIFTIPVKEAVDFMQQVLAGG